MHGLKPDLQSDFVVMWINYAALFINDKIGKQQMSRFIETEACKEVILCFLKLVHAKTF